MILVDTPRWPAHGSLYGHLVSDSSLWELHDFACSIGHDPRAFDHDHYDLPQRLWEEATQAGAQLVGERELVVRLREGGLRVLPGDHAPRRRRARARVVARAERQLSRWGAPPGLVEDEVRRLVEAQTTPVRWYHDLRHVDEVLARLDLLAQDAGRPSPVETESLAAIFHDVVLGLGPGADEAASGIWARNCLIRLGAPSPVVEDVERLVLVTAHHRPATGDAPAERISDADLWVLASAPGRYHVSLRDLWLEQESPSCELWSAARAAAVDAFLGRGPLFHTARGRREWELRARGNLSDEQAHLPLA